MTGGVAITTLVASGGVEQVEGGSASGTVVAAGGTQYAGGTVIAAVVQSGGTEVYGSGVLSETSMEAGAVLRMGGAIASFSFSSASDVLSVSYGGISGPRTADFQLAGNYSGEEFVLSGSDSLELAEIPCYCAGTGILTDHGEVPVEALRVGDRLVTLGGAARRLRWIGRRSFAGEFIRRNPDLLPVTIRAGALDGVLPRRDLSVSPNHALYLDGVLVPALCLIDGHGVTQARAVARVDYHHLELDRHDIVFAEGAPAETYREDGNRLMFHNAAGYRLLYADAPRRPAWRAPLVRDGPILQRLRRCARWCARRICAPGR